MSEQKLENGDIIREWRYQDKAYQQVVSFVLKKGVGLELYVQAFGEYPNCRRYIGTLTGEEVQKLCEFFEQCKLTIQNESNTRQPHLFCQLVPPEWNKA